MIVERTTDAQAVLDIEKAAGNVRGLREVQRRVDLSDTFLARPALGAPGVAVGTLRVYERDERPALAWIGGMSTRPDARRQGAARAIVRAMLARAIDELAVPVLGLDASAMGRPLYEQLGFVEVARSSRWKRADLRANTVTSERHAVHPISISEAMEIAAFDTARFGANRMPWLMALLRDFPWQAFMTRDRSTGDVSGYAFGNDRAMGPIVADDEDAAAVLLAACERAGALRVVLAESDARTDVARMLTAAGYAKDGAMVTRMTLGGKALPGDRAKVYAPATWAMG